jgi:hypothetical protein
VKYMILCYASQLDYDAMGGKEARDPESVAPDRSTGAVAKPVWTTDDFAAMGAFMESFNQELTDAGELVETRGLTAPVHTRRVRLQAGVPVVTDGPYAETQEVLAGYWVVECESFDRATEIAAKLSKCPAPPGVAETEVVDVRPIAESRDELTI